MIVAVIVLVVLGALIAVYGMGGRDWLKAQPWTAWFYKWIEPIEITLWRKSETILWSRFLVIVGLLPPLFEQLEKLNIPALQGMVPEKYQAWWTLSFTVIGIINEMMRRNTTKPLEIVELSDNVSPQVAAAVEAAQVSKDIAVATVKIDAAEKKLEDDLA